MAREAARDAGRPDRFGARDPDYHRHVTATFRALAETEPTRWHVVEAKGSAEQVTEALLGALGDLM
jgi:dTMP kinase